MYMTLVAEGLSLLTVLWYLNVIILMQVQAELLVYAFCTVGSHRGKSA